MLEGRERELDAVATLLDGARTGRGGSLVVRGIAGVGKSTLMADAMAGAHGMTVLRTQGVESESPLAFAGVQRLVRPVMRHAGAIPALQAQALRAALGESADGVPDRFLIFLATLSLLVEAADEAPVLAVVDDAHWLDDASTAALLFVARRLETERVALVFAARYGDVRSFDAEGVPELVLGGLDAGAAGRLLSERASVPAAAPVAEALVAATGGNALALAELAGVLSPDELTGRVPLPSLLPLTDGVERAFLGRFRDLPPAARAALLVAAADDSGRMATLVRAAAEVGAGEDGLELAERSGLLRVRGGTAELRHPLVRSAVYGAATTAERRRVHRALARALDATDDADRRAWHLAASVTEPDEDVVAELDRAAERAHRRGGHEAASATWERAAELSAGREARASRMYRAALSAWMAAQPGRARALGEAAWREVTEPALRADVARLRGQIEFNVGSLTAGHRIVLEGAAEVSPHDARRAAEMAMLAAALAAFGAPSDAGPDPGALVGRPPEDAAPRDRCLAELVQGLTAVARGDRRTAAPNLRRAVALAPALSDEADEDLLLNLGVATWHLGDDDAALRLQDRLLESARRRGALIHILHALTRRNVAELATGRWAAARAAATEAVSLAETSGHDAAVALPLATLAVLDAACGDDPEPRVARVERAVATHPQAITAGMVDDLLRWARALTAPDPAVAFHHLARLVTPPLQQAAALERLEAAARSGRRDRLEEWVGELADFAAATGAPHATAAAEHGRALLTEGPGAEEHFRAALAAHAASLRVPDRARTKLAYGEFLRRSRRRVDAREHLRSALRVFEDLGAEPLADRARAELRASGETARRRDAVVPTVELTAQEVQVARLVASGMSNREVAARMFLSPRTIDFHLRNVFTKLGITNRTELAAHPLT